MSVSARAIAIARPTWPDTATVVVVFLLYTNAAAVAVKVHGLPFAIGAFVLAPLLAAALYQVAVRGEPVTLDRALWLTLAFVAVQLVGAMVSARPADALSRLLQDTLAGLVLYLALVNIIRTRTLLRRTVRALLLAGACMGVLVLHQQATGSFQSNYWGFAQIEEDAGFAVTSPEARGTQKRLAGPIGEKNFFAAVMLMLIPLGLMFASTEPSRRLRLQALLATGLTAVGCALAFSRGAAAAFVVVLGVMAVMRYVRIRQLGLAVAGAALLLLALPQYAERLTSVSIGGIASVLGQAEGQVTQVDGAVEGRITEMLAAARVFLDHPVIGVGPGQFKYYSAEYGNQNGLKLLEGRRQAHNLYLGLAAETGIIGIGAFLGVLAVTLRNLARVRRQCLARHPELAGIAAGCFLSIVAYMALGMFLSYSFVSYLWLMLGIGAATVGIADRARRADRLPLAA